MIIIEISGGLGNQMFQYALGQKFISMGKEVKYDLSFYNDRVQTLRQFELDIFDLDCPVASNSELSRFGKGNSLKSRLKQKIGWDKEKIYEENLDLGYQPRIFELDDIYLSGYWQSELYFKDIREQILSIYRLPEEMNEKSRKFLLRIKEDNSVSIHVRRGDYLNKENYRVYGGICTNCYYKKAIEYMRKSIDNPKFYIFTNDSEWAKMQFKENDMEVVECNNRNNSYLDMFLMSSCKANIIANSTFSWWGAWLNSGQEKLVIAPKKWFNNHEINDIVCESWIKIDSQGEI